MEYIFEEMFMENDEVNISLDRRAALVLFDWLADRKDESNIALDVALLQFEASLESILVEPFQPDYQELVDKAASELRSFSGEQ